MIGTNNKVLNFLVAGSILSPVASSYQLRRRANQQQCAPVQRDTDSCMDSLFVLLELEEKYDAHSGSIYSDIEQSFQDTYNSVTDCTQNGADRSINSVTVLDHALLKQYDDDDDFPKINGTGLLFEIDLSCNSCGQDYWQVFEGTEVGLVDAPSPPGDSNTCSCEGPKTPDFVGALQDTINKLASSNGETITVVNATQIPLLYPEDDDYCKDPASQTTFGYYGVCPGNKDNEFSCMYTEESTESPTESPTSYPTYSPTQSNNQPGDCPGGYEDKVYIHTGCTTGKAGFAEDKDCPGGKCEMGPGYYCTDGKSVSKLNYDFDQDYYICKDCASKTAYYEVNDGTWYCQM